VDAGVISGFFSTNQAGSGTYYGDGVKTNGGGACGFGTMYPDFAGRSSPAVTLIAAPPAVYGGDGGVSDGCGMCVQLSGTGAGSGANPISKTPFIGFIQDKCPGCGSKDLDLAKNGDGRWNINWKAVACPVTSSDKLWYKFEGSNNWYVKLQVVNHKLPLKGVTLVYSGKNYPLTRTADNFWTCPNVPSGGFSTSSFTVKVTSSSGETITDTIPITGSDIGKNNDMKIQGKAQFAGSSGIMEEDGAGHSVDSQTALYIGLAVGCAILVVAVIVVIVVIRRKSPQTEIA
jgi:hypothetical protein